MGGARSSTTSSRRRFLGTAAGATGAALGAVALGSNPVNEPSAIKQAELYVEQMAFHLPPGAEPPPSP